MYGCVCVQARVHVCVLALLQLYSAARQCIHNVQHLYCTVQGWCRRKRDEQIGRKTAVFYVHVDHCGVICHPVPLDWHAEGKGGKMELSNEG